MGYELVRSPDAHLMGILQPNGSYSGVMGLLKRQEADASLSLYSVSYERSKHVDFSIPLFIDEWRVVFKRPVLEPDIMGFIKPYTFWMWMYMLLTLVIVLAVTATLQWGWTKYGASSRPKAYSIWFYYDKYFLWILGLLLTHSMGWYPRGESGRMIAAMWLLAGIVLSTVYKSNLKAMLIRPSVNIPFKDIREMLDQDVYSWKVPFENLPHQVMRVSIIYVCYHLVCNYLTSILDISGAKTGTCAFYIIPHGFLKNNPVAMIFPLGSPLKDKVNDIIMHLNEYGILSHLKNRYLRNATRCMAPPGSETLDKLRPLEIVDFIGVFLLFGAGMLVATLCLLLELTVATAQVCKPSRPFDGENIGNVSINVVDLWLLQRL
ncbi:glutamate receptor ionotropic, delta-2-like [Oratosquilla oratoria]|uniref:glutamate receptor ionotropic, delta-2-like n=1 Tax=Oratosquilla oratoria TaxID=337810 RepID=UPI003F7691F2